MTVPRDINQDVASGSVPQSQGDQSVRDDLSVTDDVTIGGGLTFSAQQYEIVAANKTLDAADSVHQVVTVDAVVVTLPSTAVGLCYTIINGAEDGAALVSVSPAAADKIIGNGFTATDNKDAQNTKATAKKGDRITLIGDGVDGWMVFEVRGIWARE
jgi:hypothetical protein